MEWGHLNGGYLEKMTRFEVERPGVRKGPSGRLRRVPLKPYDQCLVLSPESLRRSGVRVDFLRSVELTTG